MSKFKVVMTGKTWPEPYERIKEHCDVKMWEGPGSIPREQLMELLVDAEGLFNVDPAVRIDKELLDSAPNLRIVAQVGVGYDNVDVEACTKKGVLFSNTPGVLVEAVANLTFGLLLTATRRIHLGAELVKSGQWQEVMGIDLYGKKLGIVGMGDIGSEVAKRAHVCGMEVIYHNRTRRQDDDDLMATYVPFDTLLKESDFIVVLVPLSESSRGMFGKEEFEQMKSTSYFLNVSRGPVVDSEALYEALKNNKIAYAALDVTDPEPLPGDHALLELHNILITPHIGSATYETRNSMNMLAVDNLIAGLSGEKLPTPVN